MLKSNLYVQQTGHLARFDVLLKSDLDIQQSGLRGGFVEYPSLT